MIANVKRKHDWNCRQEYWLIGIWRQTIACKYKHWLFSLNLQIEKRIVTMVIDENVKSPPRLRVDDLIVYLSTISCVGFAIQIHPFTNQIHPQMDTTALCLGTIKLNNNNSIVCRIIVSKTINWKLCIWNSYN